MGTIILIIITILILKMIPAQSNASRKRCKKSSRNNSRPAYTYFPKTHPYYKILKRQETRTK